MITAAQMRAARALLGLDQRQLAELSGVSLPTIRRMEASQGHVRGIVGSLTRVIEALNAAGVDLIGDEAASPGGGRGVRLKHPASEQHPARNQKPARGQGAARSQESTRNQGPAGGQKLARGQGPTRGQHPARGQGTAQREGA